MTQSELDSAVSNLTGEDISEIRRRGFSLIDPFDPDFDTEPDDLLPQMVDWDQLQRDRQAPFVDQRLNPIKRAA